MTEDVQDWTYSGKRAVNLIQKCHVISDIKIFNIFTSFEICCELVFSSCPTNYNKMICPRVFSNCLLVDSVCVAGQNSECLTELKYQNLKATHFLWHVLMFYDLNRNSSKIWSLNYIITNQLAMPCCYVKYFMHCKILYNMSFFP